MKSSIAIIGAGNGGQAFAGYLSLHGHEVKIFDVVQKTVDRLNENGGVLLEGNSDVTGFGKILLASTDIGQVMEGAKIILIVLPSLYHKDMAKKMMPYLKDDQCVVLNPNASLGTIVFKKQLDDLGCKANIMLACTATLLFACRAVSIGHVVVAGQKTSFTASTYPSARNQEAKELFANVLPQFDFCEDIIRVSLDNLNAFMHPGPTILNTGRIESKTPFEYYLDMTPSQVKFIEALDKERMAIAKEFGVGCKTLKEEYLHIYDTYGETLHQVITNCEGYHGIKGQTTLNTRYIMEDIPCSLVAIQTMGKLAQVATPCIDAMIIIANAMVDHIEEGRTLRNLGLEDVSKTEFIAMCRGEGIRHI